MILACLKCDTNYESQAAYKLSQHTKVLLELNLAAYDHLFLYYVIAETAESGSLLDNTRNLENLSALLSVAGQLTKDSLYCAAVRFAQCATYKYCGGVME